jgi:hypothetical protein
MGYLAGILIGLALVGAAWIFWPRPEDKKFWVCETCGHARDNTARCPGCGVR